MVRKEHAQHAAIAIERIKPKSGVFDGFYLAIPVQMLGHIY